jgi:hypothetical protein
VTGRVMRISSSVMATSTLRAMNCCIFSCMVDGTWPTICTEPQRSISTFNFNHWGHCNIYRPEKDGISEKARYGHKDACLLVGISLATKTRLTILRLSKSRSPDSDLILCWMVWTIQYDIIWVACLPDRNCFISKKFGGSCMTR